MSLLFGMSKVTLRVDPENKINMSQQDSMSHLLNESCAPGRVPFFDYPRNRLKPRGSPKMEHRLQVPRVPQAPRTMCVPSLNPKSKAGRDMNPRHSAMGASSFDGAPLVGLKEAKKQTVRSHFEGIP